MRFFKYADGELTLDEPYILLIPEFHALMDHERNKCVSDPQGKKCLRAFREFTYMWLAIDWQSIYSSKTPSEQHKLALKDANLTEDEFNNEVFREACRKYQTLQEDQLPMQLLFGARHAAREVANFFNTITISDKYDEGTSPKDVIDNINKCAPLMETMRKFEEDVKKNLQIDKKGLRGEQDKGFRDGGN